MIKTDNFVKHLLACGFVDEVDFVASGYDIKCGKDVVSVRSNKQRAIIWNHKDSRVTEIKSSRLDDVLHRYIVLSFADKISGKTNLGNYKNVIFLPQGVVEGKVIFKDSKNRDWIANGYSAKNVMDFYNEAKSVSAEDTLVLMNGFEPYEKGCKVVKSSVKDEGAEKLMLKSNVNVDDYSVYPCSSAINKIGTTLVGSFLASSVDRANVELFENFENEIHEKKSLHSSNVSIKNYKTKGVAEAVRQTIVSSGKANEFDKFCDKNYGNGITEESLNSALVYDTGKIYSALGIKKPLEHFKPIVQSMLEESDSAYIQLKSNKEVCVCAQKVNLFSAMFSAIPDVEAIKNGLSRDGYTLQDIQSGMTVALDSETLGAVINSSLNFSPMPEKSYLNELNKKNLIGSAVTDELKNFGIYDKNRAFSNMIIFTVD